MKTPPPLPATGTAPVPTRQLLRATAAAIVAASVIVVTFVAPAEYGVDPTGVGAWLGLRRPAAVSAISSVPVAPEAAATVKQESAPFRSDQMQVTLAWGEDVEIKASMLRGQQFVFGWTTDGAPVNFDMHGEPSRAGPSTGGRDELGAGEAAVTSYWKGEEQTSASGSFQAPFDGLHGWYWENFNEKPVTITLKTSGYYSKLARQ